MREFSAQIGGKGRMVEGLADEELSQITYGVSGVGDPETARKVAAKLSGE